MCNVKFHPLDSELQAFVAAELSPSLSMMISAHLELCSHCRERTEAIEQANAMALANEQALDLTDDLAAMMNNIMEQKAEPAPKATELLVPAEPIRVNQRAFKLPRILRGHRQQIGPWSKLPGNVQRAPIHTASESKMNLIYMDGDSALPEHTHTGREITLVLAGEFVDENGTYGPGDFIVQTEAHKHLPRTMPGNDCLCLTLLDAPLKFTSGVATLLNPFSQLFFR